MLVIGDDEEEDEDDDDEDDDMVHISKRMKGDRESQYGGAGAFRRRWPAEEELAKKTMKVRTCVCIRACLLACLRFDCEIEWWRV